jgi:uncharacterized protein
MQVAARSETREVFIGFWLMACGLPCFLPKSNLQKMSASSNTPQAAIEPAVATPCIHVCAMGPAGFCLGCARTLIEIASWTMLTPGECLAIMEKLPARKAALASDSPL